VAGPPGGVAGLATGLGAGLCSVAQVNDARHNMTVLVWNAPVPIRTVVDPGMSDVCEGALRAGAAAVVVRVIVGRAILRAVVGTRVIPSPADVADIAPGAWTLRQEKGGQQDRG
jgi:hypothetical protein